MALPDPGGSTDPRPLRPCLLSGGASRRMGRDKALLPHPDGGTWLDHSLRRLVSLGAPVTLCSAHPEHLRRAAAFGAAVTPWAEPPPHEGPLLALARLMALHPGERLLLCPVDMPHLDDASLRALVAAAEGDPDPDTIHLAHDGERLQPLLGLYPASADRRQRLAAHLAGGDRSLQRWLTGEHWRPLVLPAPALRNINHPDELDPPPPRDRLGRPLGVLRLSLTARCNLACPYCLPDGHEPPGLLTLAQRRRLVAAAVALGASQLRLTGGEPLLHDGVEALIASVADLRSPGGLREVALTSNGALLTIDRARALRAAGLDRLTLSLDGTSGASVAAMAGLTGGAAAGEALLQRVLAAIAHGRAAGFDPARGQLKLNAVIQRGRNDDQLLPLAALARERAIELRLIEYMDVGNRNGWRPEAVLSAAEMVDRIGRQWPLQPLGRGPHGTAARWRYTDGGGHLAVVASVSAPFCGDCNRLRVTADGIAYTCLFAAPASGLDLRPWLAADTSDDALHQVIADHWRQRADRWSEERQQAWVHGGPGSAAAAPAHAEMAYLGG